MTLASDPRAEAALLAMQRNREQLLATFAPESVKRDRFPRSATFRWVASHLTTRSVATTLLSAAVARPAWLRLLAMVVARRRRR